MTRRFCLNARHKIEKRRDGPFVQEIAIFACEKADLQSGPIVIVHTECNFLQKEVFDFAFQSCI